MRFRKKTHKIGACLACVQNGFNHLRKHIILSVAPRVSPTKH